MTFEETRERIIAINDELRRLEAEKKICVQQLQEQCVHPEIIAFCPLWYDLEEYCRICLVCGFPEDYNINGYQKLKRVPVRTLFHHEEFNYYRLNFIR